MENGPRWSVNAFCQGRTTRRCRPTERSSALASFERQLHCLVRPLSRVVRLSGHPLYAFSAFDMTRRELRRWVRLVIGFYVTVAMLAIGFRIQIPEQTGAYETFLDIIPLLVAFPAAWLGVCFQRRASFLKQLRDLWSSLIRSIQSSIQYTHLSNPSQGQFGSVMSELSCVIDDFRSVYSNLEEEEGKPGFFPFESLKMIRKEISGLWYGEGFRRDECEAARGRIIKYWKTLRQPLLHEFDRHEPTHFDSPYTKH